MANHGTCVDALRKKHGLKKNETFPAEDRTVCIHDNIFFNAGLISSISYN